jgi:Ca-activated chloride channel family protein
MSMFRSKKVRSSVSLALVLAVAGCGGGRYSGAAYTADTTSTGYAYAGAEEAEPTGGEQYSHTPENQFVDAQEDAMATLSLDVDTASYTLMRRDLLASRLPHPESVRVEEWINFFDYAEAPRANGQDPIAVSLESAPSPFGDGMNLLRVAVQAHEIPQEQRPSANLVFLVDVSGSMADANKLPLVQESLGILLDALRPDDTVAIVVYAGADAVLLQPTPIMERAHVLDAVMSLGAGGSTNGAAGIRTAYDLASQHLRPGGINRVILCTDGDFNVGVTGDELIRLIERERERGITLSVLGFGSGNYNDRDMERLADHGNGNYAYIDSRNEALRVLARDLDGTLQVVAKDVKIQVQFDDQIVRRFRLVGYENRVLAHEDFANDAVDAAEVGSGDHVTAFFEYELERGVDPSQHEGPLAEVRVRWKPADGTESTERTYGLALGETRANVSRTTPAFRFGAAVAELAEILRRSEHSEGARFDDVISLARSASYQTDDARELLDLARRAKALYR